MVCSEWWTFESGVFVTGSIDGVQLAAYTITLNLTLSGFVVGYLHKCFKSPNMICYMLPEESIPPPVECHIILGLPISLCSGKKGKCAILDLNSQVNNRNHKFQAFEIL